MSGGNAHDRKKFEDAVEREVQRRLKSPTQSVHSEPTEEEPKTRRSSPKKPSAHSLLVWLRGAGIASFIFGLGTMIFAGWYWVGVVLIYVAFLLVATDLWFETSLSKSARVIGIILIALVIAGFSVGFVFVDAPLPVTAYVTDGEYPEGTDISGIPWKPQFTELRVQFDNNTDRTYEDLNIVIRPNDAVAAITQSTNVPSVSFEDKNDMSERIVDVDLGTGMKRTIPLDLLATDAGYRMRCPRLAGQTVVRVVMALADVRWNPNPPSSVRLPSEIMREPEYIQKFKNIDFSTYWLGHRYGNVYTPRPTSSSWVMVDGQYTVLQRRRTISQKIEVGGQINARHL
jgi:hypothetical protein